MKKGQIERLARKVLRDIQSGEASEWKWSDRYQMFFKSRPIESGDRETAAILEWELAQARLNYDEMLILVKSVIHEDGDVAALTKKQ